MKTHTIRTLLAPLMVLVLYILACNTMQARDFVVVIDPGHGGKDVGCVGNYSYEKDIVLAVGKMLGDKIKKNYDNVKVIYTRDTDRFIALQDRADKANRNHADLFISIHVNSVAAKTKNRTTVQGTSVYTLGAERTAANLEVAKRENSVIILEEDYTTKYGGYDPDNPESAIMMGLLQNRYINESIDFATMAQNQLVKTAGRADHEVKQAGFLVLRNVSAPAVLIELDFICNPTQEKFLSSKAGQEKLATALYNAFRSYMSAKLRQANIAIEEPKATETKATETKATETKANETKDDETKDDGKDKKSKDRSKDKKDKDKKDPKDAPSVSAPVAQNTTPTVSQQSQPQAQTQPKAEQKPQTQTQPSQQQSQAKPQQQTSQSTPQQAKPQQQTQQQQPQKVQTDPQTQPSQQSQKIPTTPQTQPSQPAQKVPIPDQNQPSETAQKVPTPTEHVQKQFKNAQAVGVPQPGVLQYKVQLFTSGKLLKAGAPEFKGLQNVDYYKDGVYKYTVGLTSDKEEAEKLMRSVQSKFPQAFIIQWKDGRRVK